MPVVSPTPKKIEFSILENKINQIVEELGKILMRAIQQTQLELEKADVGCCLIYLTLSLLNNYARADFLNVILNFFY